MRWFKNTIQERESVNKSDANVWKKLIFFGRVYAESGLLSIHLWINVKLPALKGGGLPNGSPSRRGADRSTMDNLIMGCPDPC